MNRWYAAYTQPRNEALAIEHLARQGFDVYCPRYQKRRSHAGKIDLVASPLFPRYVFIAFDPEAARWQAFLDDRFKAALSRGSLGLLAGLTFVAVYREAFEKVLFFQALAAQAGPEGRGALVAGMGAGVVLLVVLALSIFRLGQRLPMRRFFAASSVLLYGLAVVLAGHGIAALQEAGWIPATPASFFRFEWLGIYPTWQGLALQAALLVAALAALPMLAGGLQKEPRRA